MVKVPNTGVRVDSREAIVVLLTVQKWLPEKKQMHLRNIWHFSTQMTKETSQTLTSK